MVPRLKRSHDRHGIRDTVPIPPPLGKAHTHSLQTTMAEAILDQVNASNMFDLRGVVAVVTGGGSVSDYSVLGRDAQLSASLAGYWPYDGDDAHV